MFHPINLFNVCPQIFDILSEHKSSGNMCE